MDKAVHAGHRKRMRQKILSGGISGFQDHEVLEYLLFYTIPRKNTNELGHLILDKFGSLAALSQASIDDICEIPGISRKSAAFIKYLPQLADHISSNQSCDDAEPLLAGSAAVAEYMRHEFYGVTTSTVKLCCLTGALRLINTVTVIDGILTGSPDEMLKIVSATVENNSRNIVLAANHVNDSFFPSRQEIDMVNRIAKQLAAIDIRLVDYIILSSDGIPLSLRNAGYVSLK